MNTAVKLLFLALAFTLLAAIGCGSVSSGRSFAVAATPTPTPVSTPTPGPSPTPTPIPTPTPGPSPTPTPFPTPTPGPSPTPTPFPTPTPVPTSTLVFVGSHVSGGVTVFRLGADGSLTEVPGAGVTGNFQVSALAQSGQSLIAAQGNDTGTAEQVNLYSIQPQTGVLSLRAMTTIAAPVLDARGALSAAMNEEFVYIGTGNGIYAFSLADGNLTPVPGSPFQTGSANDASNFAAFGFLKINGAFLMAARGTNSAIQTFQIDGNGALMPRGASQSSDAVTSASFGKGVAEDPAGRFLVGIFGDDTGESVMAFKIDATTGAVTSLPGSHRVGPTRPDIVIANF